MTTILSRQCKDGSIKTWSTSGNFRGGKITNTCEHCKNEFQVFQYRKESKYCSRKCLAKSKTGENSKNWKGGVTDENKKIRHSEEYNKWRKAVYERDYWTCQHCEIKQKFPVAHHIKNFNDYPDLRFDVENGITLCRSCHKKVHEEIGYKTRFTKQLTTL